MISVLKLWDYTSALIVFSLEKVFSINYNNRCISVWDKHPSSSTSFIVNKSFNFLFVFNYDNNINAAQISNIFISPLGFILSSYINCFLLIYSSSILNLSYRANANGYDIIFSPNTDIKISINDFLFILPLWLLSLNIYYNFSILKIFLFL